MVPVWREMLADVETPVSAFAKLVGDDDGFLLESVEHAERWGRFSFVGRRPAATLIAHGGTVTSTASCSPGVPTDQGVARRHRGTCSPITVAPACPSSPFHGGLVGYLGYDVVREIERLPDIPSTTSASPTR